MKKIALCGYEDKTKNYRAVLEHLACEVVVGLDIEKAKDCEALLLPGGGDIAPSYYKEEIKGSKEADAYLDEKQFEILDYFVKSRKPVLGICRGLQLINVYFGGTLIQDLESKKTHTAVDEEKNIDNEHLIECIDESFLKEIYGKEFRVNSWHHQGIKELAKDFRVIARAKDGVIEAIESKKNNVIALQFHPERMSLSLKKDDLVDGIKIFEYFLNRMV